MKKLSLLLMPTFLLAATTAHAEDAENYGWSAVLKKAAVEVSSTEVKNSKEYKDSPNAELSGDSETVTKGIFDFSLINQQEKIQMG